ncbi:MAG: methyltransferase domain-containing protein [Kiloniellales bacterium]|nr:methyltransferase domain-containing protein [Kiloniellales bacterium]
MPCTREELEQKARYDEYYNRAQIPFVYEIERRVCGCDFGGNSWTTRRQADEIIERLQLRPGVRMLDLGAGTGWPALYFVGQSGCDAVLADLPENGLRIARERAAKDGLSELVASVVSDAAELCFPEEAFDAVSHSDLLCCLVRKRSVLASCRRVIRSQGRMAFTVISIMPGLSQEQYRKAAANGPEFVESEADYPTLLKETGWRIIDRQDITAAYASACERQIEADEDYADELSGFLGAREYKDRLAGWHDKLFAIENGLLQRELFVAAAASL